MFGDIARGTLLLITRRLGFTAEGDFRMSCFIRFCVASCARSYFAIEVQQICLVVPDVLNQFSVFAHVVLADILYSHCRLVVQVASLQSWQTCIVKATIALRRIAVLVDGMNSA